MHVEYTFADGRTALVAVPRERWHASGHLPVGRHLAELLERLDLQRERAAGRVP